MKIVILGSTGSIGTQALKILYDSMSDGRDVEIIGLACGNNLELLEKQIEVFNPKYVSTINKSDELIKKYPEITFYYGEEGLAKMAKLPEADTVLNSLVGSSGFYPSVVAIENNKKLLLSNKESLVIGGEIIKQKLKEYNGTLYPIDSEHCSLWELFDEYDRSEIDYCTITASGGPFRDFPIEKLNDVTINDALNHPNWKMGKKISIDSATMMNKGFEVIEAYYLFDIPLNKIKTIINLESLVHASITLKNGKEIYGVDKVSMENPIRRALFYPEITYNKEIHDESEFHFREIDKKRYPCLELAYEVMEKKGLYPTILNASNESAVNLFLKGQIKFTDIYRINKEVLDSYEVNDLLSVENILKYDKSVKDYVINTYGGEK